MPFKINIGTKEGKTFRLEVETENLIGKKIGEKIDGSEISDDLAGYELEIMGTSDQAGMPGFKEIEGPSLKRVLLKFGKGMHKRSKKEGKKKRSNPRPKGLKLRKTVRGNIISKDTIQINTKLLKEGSKKLENIFPDQAKKTEAKVDGEKAGEIKEKTE